jgi:hypothetical protein
VRRREVNRAWPVTRRPAKAQYALETFGCRLLTVAILESVYAAPVLLGSVYNAAARSRGLCSE